MNGVRKKDGKTGRGFAVNAFVHGKLFDWTCPKCNLRNTNNIWLGRMNYCCEGCTKLTNVKGHTIGMNKAVSLIEIL